MLYLNWWEKINLEASINLTLTSVVFEFKYVLRMGRKDDDLTLTSVVFEFAAFWKT